MEPSIKRSRIQSYSRKRNSEEKKKKGNLPLERFVDGVAKTDLFFEFVEECNLKAQLSFYLFS